MADQKVHFMSDNSNWGTPPEFIEFLKRERMMTFDLDPCASFQNKKAQIYFSEKEDGLKQAWFGDVWLNPPYGREQRSWLEKAAFEVAIGNADSVTALIPARTDTKWFHDVVMEKAYLVYFIKGRFNFVSPNGTPGANAPFPSMLVIFRQNDLGRTLRISGPAGLTTMDVPKEARGFY